jgi:hypothetical protein
LLVLKKPENRMEEIMILGISIYFTKDHWIPRVRLSSRKFGAFIST